MPIPPESLQPAHDKLRDIWQISSTEENRIQECIRNTPDPVTGVNPEREDMIRSFEIVRAHRRYTRSCIDALAWGKQVDHLSLPQDKAKAIRSTEAAAAFGGAVSIAADDCITALYNLGHDEEDSGRAITEENVRAIARNLRYALDSAKADLRKGIR